MKFNTGKHKVLCLFLFLKETTSGTSIIWGQPSWTAAWQKSTWGNFVPHICLTIVQIFGNNKIPCADLIPGNRVWKHRKLCRAATLSIHCLLPAKPCMGILKHVLLSKTKIRGTTFLSFHFLLVSLEGTETDLSQYSLQRWKMFPVDFPPAGGTMRGHFPYLAIKTVKCISLRTGATSRIRKQSFWNSYWEKKRWTKYHYLRFKYSSIPSLFSHLVALMTLKSNLWSDLTRNTGQSFDSISDRWWKDLNISPVKRGWEI